jgi:hypothetical protein
MSYVLVAAGIATVIGVGANMYNQRQVANEQDSQLASSLRQQAQLQDQASQASNKLIQQTADSTPAAAKSSLLSQYTAQLASKKALTSSGLNQVGNVSNAYNQDANAAASGISNYGSTTANLLSNIDAPELQRQNENANLTAFGSNIGLIKSNSDADNFLAQMRLRGITANPYLTALGGLGTGMGSALAGSYTGGSGAGSASTLDGGGANWGTVNLPFK